MKEKVEAINALLPQTQCGECGFAGCLPYAEALAQGQTSIDCCPPGGIFTLKKLASFLSIDPEPYISAVQMNTRKPSLAVINEKECIGCTKCIQACPVDAILGSAKSMHTIIANECTGCELCVAPCPVDCIDLIETTPARLSPEDRPDKRQTSYYRQRFIDREQRLQNEKRIKQDRHREESGKERENYVLAALERVRAKTDRP